MLNRTKRRFETAGWFLFIVSAVFYIAAGWRSGDVISLLGGIFFFLACFVFLVPLHGHRVPDEDA